jgi:Concanavalin A-like lectin/glucanases superfamily
MSELAQATFYRGSQDQPLQKMNTLDWSSDFDTVLAGNFSNYQFNPYSEIIMYDGTFLYIRSTDGQGNYGTIDAQYWIGPYYKIITSGNFLGSQKEVLLLYSEGSSPVVGGSIRIRELGQYGNLMSTWTDFGTEYGWDIIATGNYNGANSDDIVCYNKQTGRLVIYDTDINSNSFPKIVDTQEEKGWSSIVLGNFRKQVYYNPYRSEVLFYNKQTGKVKLMEADFLNNYQLKIVKEFQIEPNCDILVKGRFIQGSEYGLLLYNSGKGSATRYRMDYSDNLVPIQVDKFPKFLKAIVCGTFFKPALQPTDLLPSLRDLLVYGVDNKAIYLPWEGYVDTNIDFSRFFDNDHTLMCWFMPQFGHMYRQPIIAENGTGKYMIGVGDYTEGNVIYNKDHGKIFNTAGNSVIYIQVGDEERIYLVPEFLERKWSHIALVRNSNTFQLYINGQHKYPVRISVEKGDKTEVTEDGEQFEVLKSKTITSYPVVPEITFTSSNFSNKPSGTVRFGRRTAGASQDQAKYQAYGIIDEVAIFRGPVSFIEEYQRVKPKRRLTGNETDLMALWSFDSSPSSGTGTSQPWTFSTSPDGKVIPVIVSVSGSRNSEVDSKLFEQPYLVNTHIVVDLPFKAGEEHNVSQGMNSAINSHMGSSAFCYDLCGPAYHPVLIVKKGIVIGYRQDNDSAPREGNRITLKISKTRAFGYLHLAKNSLNPNVSGGSWTDPDGVPNTGDEYIAIPEASAPQLNVGEPAGKIGPNALHLHCGGLSEIGNLVLSLHITTPLAFRNYKVYDSYTNNWYHVDVGFPRADDLIKAE